MSRTIQVTFDAHDPFAAWHTFLADAGVPESEWNSASAAEDPEGTGPRLFFQRVPEPKSAKNRVHLDLRAAPGLQGEERHEPALPMTPGHIWMRDPEGNEFCLG